LLRPTDVISKRLSPFFFFWPKPFLSRWLSLTARCRFGRIHCMKESEGNGRKKIGLKVQSKYILSLTTSSRRLLALTLRGRISKGLEELKLIQLSRKSFDISLVGLWRTSAESTHKWRKWLWECKRRSKNPLPERWPGSRPRQIKNSITRYFSPVKELRAQG